MNLTPYLIERIADWLADNNSNFQLETMFLKYGFKSWDFEGGSKHNKALFVMSEIAAREDKDKFLGDIFEKIIERLNWKMLNRQSNKFDRQLILALRAEGYEIEGGKIIPAPPLESMIEKTNLLVKLLDKKEWFIAKGHLSQALDNFQRGNWAACNSQLRSMLEEVFNCIAQEKNNNIAMPLSGGNARKHLEKNGFLSLKEGEFIQSWFGILHTSGSHPGLSSQEDTQWRLFVTASTAYWIIKVLDSRKNE